MNSEKQPDPSKETIDQMDDLDFQILALLDQIGSKDVENFEDTYCYHVGSFSKLLRQLLDQYHEESRSREGKMKLKPHLLYFREIQQYLVYFVRFPVALYQKNHPYMKELREMIKKKGYLLKAKYKEKAINERMLFESDFREKLEKTLNRRRLGDGN